MNLRKTTFCFCNLFITMAIGITVWAQGPFVSGVVLDIDGIPLPGVSVIEKGKNTGAITDLDGAFYFQVASRESTIVFSFIGMETQEVLVEDQKIFKITMSERATLMDEIIVVGYGTQKRSTISGAVSVVTSDEIEKLPSLRVEQALQGRTAGVLVSQNSGSPGAELTVRVRGAGTINNSDPLYVVDGIPVDGLDFLNPNEIESMSVLKDASAAAIYGARAANGVVLITTKTGKKNQKPQLEYNGYFGSQKAWKKLNLLSAREYAILDNEGRIAAGLATRPEFKNPESLGEGTDWQDELFVTAPMQSHQISLTGGGEKSRYAMSGSYFNQDGIVGGAKANFERKTFRVNMVNDLSSKLEISTKIGYTNFNRDALTENNEFNTPIVRTLNIDPVTPVKFEDGNYAYSPYVETDIVNPINAIANTNSTWTSNRLLGGFTAKYEIINGLTFKTNLGLDLTFSSDDGFTPEYGTYSNDVPANERNDLSSVFKENHQWVKFLFENTLAYDFEIAEYNHFNIMIGNTVQDLDYTTHGTTGTDLLINDVNYAYLSLAQDEADGSWGEREQESWLSYFGRVNYEYRDKYLLSAVVRMDGSSKFGADNRWGIFPSLSLGWVLSQEEFLKESNLFSFMKLRASWGQNGNDRIPPYGFLAGVNPGYNYTFGDIETTNFGVVPIELSNSELKWETVTQTNIGLDIGVWRDRLMVSVDLYNKTTSDMLVKNVIPDVVGVQGPFINAGDVKNTGVELSLEYRKKEGRLNYNIGGNIALNKNEVISLGDSDEPILSGGIQFANGFISRTEVGHPVASFYGFQTDGLYQNWTEVEQGIQDKAAPGDIRFKDLNEDGVIDDDDKTYIGNPTPDMIYSVSGGASFEGFDLNIFVQGTKGNDLFKGYTRYDFNNVNQPVSRLNRWTGEGSTDIEPRVVYGDPNENARISDRFVEDGSYLRIKNIQLGYTVPQKIFGNGVISNLRLYVSANNLWTFTKYSGLDPEIGTRDDLEIGIDRGFYPPSRSFLGGINLTF